MRTVTTNEPPLLQSGRGTPHDRREPEHHQHVDRRMPKEERRHADREERPEANRALER